MKHVKSIATISIAVFSMCTIASAQEPGWPRTISNAQGTLTYYQPQVDTWQDFKTLQWRMAFTITPTGGKEIVGAATLEGDTASDVSNHMVVISNIHITNTYFPSSDPAATATMDQLLRQFVPSNTTVSLDRIVASTPKPSAPRGVPLNNSPPMIFISYKPAILLAVQGQPVFEPIHDTKLEYVVNTDWRLFRDKESSSYFLLIDKQWLTSSNLQGTWSSATNLPKDMQKMLQEPAWQDLKSVIPPPQPQPNAVIPAVFYSTSPADIVLFDGQPTYSAISGTQLVYANNSNSYIFVYSPTKTIYYLTAGRWFSASGLQGPWTYATESLPPDFAKIPAASPPGIVLASVPGTEEAKDAVLIAEVPTTVTVNPSVAAEAKVTYEGAPNFAPIQGTSLSYATNTAQRVIQVESTYYLCLNGIWFSSTNPQGPWQTAQSVPQAIYTIPPSSPVYNVTYVTQTTTPTGNVQASYTAGYFGAFVMGAATGAIIASGTGYYYPPVYGAGYYGYPTYHPYPCTYGAAPYYNATTGAYGAYQSAYGPYGSAARSASYNPYTGTYARSGEVSTPYGHAAAGQAYNPYTGAYGETRQGSNAYGSWGSSAVSTPYGSAYSQHESGARGSEGSVQTSASGKAGATSTAYGNTLAGKTAGGDMYADRNGNVYKNTGSGWQSYNNGSWNSVNSEAQQRAQSYEQQRPAGQEGGQGRWGGGSGFSSEDMNREFQDRQRGEMQSQRFSGWGGGRSFGGGRR